MQNHLYQATNMTTTSDEGRTGAEAKYEYENYVPADTLIQVGQQKMVWWVVGRGSQLLLLLQSHLRTFSLFHIIISFHPYPVVVVVPRWLVPPFPLQYNKTPRSCLVRIPGQPRSSCCRFYS